MRYLATFHAREYSVSALPLSVRQFDVTPEIDALGGAIPRADSHGTDLLQYATHAPDWIKGYRGPFSIEVTPTPDAPSTP